MSKLLIIFVCALLLGGCVLNQYFPGRGDAAKDEQSAPAKSPLVSDSPAPSLSTSTDPASLEADLDSTLILDEDFSDLK